MFRLCKIVDMEAQTRGLGQDLMSLMLEIKRTQVLIERCVSSYH